MLTQLQQINNVEIFCNQQKRNSTIKNKRNTKGVIEMKID